MKDKIEIFYEKYKHPDWKNTSYCEFLLIFSYSCFAVHLFFRNIDFVFSLSFAFLALFYLILVIRNQYLNGIYSK